jgi:hypothetical protein
MDSSASCCNFHGPATATLEYTTAAIAQSLANIRDGCFPIFV